MPRRDEILWARRLRREMTGVECMLWSYLRRQRLAGHKFRRQAPIGPYVADFVCLAARLVVEVDGPSHDERGEQDVRRSGWLKAEGYRVLRFTADEVLRECDWVLEVISWALAEAHRPTESRRHQPP